MNSRGPVVPVVCAVALLALAAGPPARGDKPPSAWTDRDLGSPSPAGSTDLDATKGAWTIQGSSTFLGAQADHLHFTSQLVSGDGSITARFGGMKGGHTEWSKIGLMVRANDTPGSPDLFLAMTPGHGLVATSRLVQDEENSFLGLAGPSTTQATSLFMRLQRAGSEVTGFYSRDGLLWYQAGFPPQTLAALPDAASFGLAATSLQDGALTSGGFTNVTIQNGAASVYGLWSCGGEKMVRLQWRPLKNATAYNIYRGPSGTALPALVPITSSPVTGTSFTDNSTDLVNGTAQTYAVAAIFPASDGTPVEGPRVAITGTPVAAPSGFLGCSINEGVRSGSANLDPATGTITLRGSGVLTLDNADGLYFLNQPMTGDFQTTVRVLNPPQNASNWAVAGLMLREALDAGSRYAAVWTTGASSGPDWPRLFSQWRGTTNGFADWPGFFALDNGALKPQVLLRLTRRGSTVTPEYSTDQGQTYQAAGPPITFSPPLATTAYVGLAISAADRGSTVQARFSDLEIK
jgi:regulation of enolase protein 1 (concanavalin A-like superfamily)